MSKTLSHLKRMTKRAYRRIGRGQGSTRGKQSGRGGKGQTARAGNKRRPELRDMIKKLPKRRGYGKNRARTVNGSRIPAFAVSLESLEAVFASGTEVTLAALAEKNVIPTHSGRPVKAKILGTGALSKKLSFKGIAVSSSAKVAIEKAGGTIILPEHAISRTSASSAKSQSKSANA